MEGWVLEDSCLGSVAEQVSVLPGPRRYRFLSCPDWKELRGRQARQGLPGAGPKKTKQPGNQLKKPLRPVRW